MLLACVSCRHSTNIKDSFMLEPLEKHVVFELDDHVTLKIKALFPFTDKEGIEYLTFQNNLQPEIYVYKKQAGEFVKKIKFDLEGKNGVGKFGGYHMESFNEIYLPSLQRNVIFVMDSSGVIQREIRFDKTDDNLSLIPFSSISFAYHPMYFNNGQLYIPQSINMRLGNEIIEKSSVTVAIDTLTKSIKPTRMRFPPIIQSADIGKTTVGGEMGYSYCFGEDQFVYSFSFDENIYVAPLDGGEIKKIQVGSKYLKKPRVLGYTPDDFDNVMKKKSEMPCYGNIIYDKYRNVYYRFAYLETQLSDKDDYAEIWSFGRKHFSIIILSSNFEIIGETLFPEFEYISTLCYVDKEGLYLSDSHYKNAQFDENELSFRCFKLLEKEIGH